MYWDTSADIETGFVTKDSWEREQFSTWAKRDTSKGKPRYDLISPHALKRVAELMQRWAEKYWDRNWEKGMPEERFLESWLRHFYQYLQWDRSEDHLSAVCFNVMAVLHFDELDGKN